MSTKVIRSFETDLDFLDGSTLMITGGTGSFGKMLTKTLLDRAKLKRLIIFSRDELKQYEMEQSFAGHAKSKCLRFFIGDVRDRNRLDMALRGVDYVIHAAALKHVPIAEYNPFECIKTNIFGAQNLAEAAIGCGVKKIVALSTDKAASPLNLYGASKLASDKIFVAANALGGNQDFSCSVVRYGNVLGSRGSVVPFFQKLIADGTDHLPVTDMRMTRFWITLQQGVDFVLSCLEMMHGGEIYIPKIPSMKVCDMAKSLAPDLNIREIGIRPGEKLHEQMITRDDGRQTIALHDRYIITPQFRFWSDKFYTEEHATPVPEGFEYSSDTNPEWLGDEEFCELLKLM
ncbi:UDP-N-acetylglucosamine 4,6-dehydratase (inverting) [Emcibacter sp.]|uniref:UDP-N-acetylglucosamine 4,6-dehydratase (inverting) n=1 Tax=Emcibacter sp. TaxID=1979954 RepID=UPI002AA96058|nr:UDP-N-acetylglucosamine 4,6-dehydratase (inverting) [Emcibacter sp.]